MQKSHIFKLTVVLLTLLSSTVSADNNEEFRAVWVITWEHISASRSVSENQANVRRILDDVKEANMTSVIWQCRQSGTAYYNSSYEPWGSYAGSSDPGYDPLAYAIEQAHLRGLELHAWFNVFNTSSTAAGTIADLHPEWICTNVDGLAMTSHRSASPGMQAVREYTIDVAMEIVRNYDIDGFHLDYVRWNEYDEDDMSASLSEIEQISKLDGFFTEEQINKLTKASGFKRYIYDTEHPASAGVPAGFGNWDDWRRAGVTEFVRTLQDSIKAVKPWIRLSPAALGKYNWTGWNGYSIVFQDAALWFNEGYIDQFMGMNYHWTTAAGFYDMLAGDCPNCWQSWIGPGIAAGRLFTVGPGSYNFGSNWNNHPSVVERIRTVPWTDGTQFFSYGSWDDRDYWETAGNSFFSNKQKIRDTQLISTAIPVSPEIATIKIDSLNYQINVTPNSPIDTSHWFAIYRSEDEDYNPDNDKILDVFFNNQVFSYTDQISGTQDFNGNYHYYATTMNRYWNESEISAVETSDSIPSLPPVVSIASISEGDTIFATNEIEISFSKTMDIETAIGNIQFVPAVIISELIWGNSDKWVTVVLQDNLVFETDYSITVTSAVRDINGAPIDGNADGIGGDDFVLNFRIRPLDDIPPEIVYAYPNDDERSLDFDVQDIITISFNELMDPDLLTSENVHLSRNSTEVITDLFINTINNRSVLSLVPEDELYPSSEYTIFISGSVTDTIGNELGEDFTYSFSTADEHYSEIRMIENFSLPGDWWAPNGSGSTVGINVVNTSFGYVTNFNIPSSNISKSGRLIYSWDLSSGSHLLREYLSGGAPRNITFDTTEVLQTYIFGDGSSNKFRFAIDEDLLGSSTWQYHEVSEWIVIDWVGWRLVEWDLSNSDHVGTWISPDNLLNGAQYRVDSYQLSYDSSGTATGVVYFDDLRAVRKSNEAVGIHDITETGIPGKFTLYQNYPNPFNPSTKIRFYLDKPGNIFVKIYDILGKEVDLLKEGYANSGFHIVEFNAANYATGVYIYEVSLGQQRLRKKMMLVK